MNEKAIEKLLNPLPGSKIAAAKEFGIDLTLLVGTSKLSPDERVRNLQISMRNFEELSRQAELWRKKEKKEA